MRFIREIARGAFGVVEEVELDDGIRAARKVFAPGTHVRALGVNSLFRRFAREIKTQASLPAEVVLPIYESALDEKPPYYVMALADRTYASQIEQDTQAGTVSLGPLTDILNCLEELHRLNYVHRDLKPTNILFQGGRWKLADFGLVLPLSGETTVITRHGDVVCSTRYAAPEQTRSFPKPTITADIFAFGCILHDLVGEGNRVPHQNIRCGGPLGPIIDRCTKLDPKKRFHNVASLRAALLLVLQTTKPTESDPQDDEWDGRLAHLNFWTGEQAFSFARHLESPGNRKILREVDEPGLEALLRLDADSWQEIADAYCEWSKGSFDFEYCDVIVGRLVKIYELGSLSVKTSALLAMAHLGADHNRWYVMRRVMGLCGAVMDATVAERLAIEIMAEDAQENFRHCARRIGKTVEDFHPYLRQTLAFSAIKIRDVPEELGF